MSYAMLVFICSYNNNVIIPKKPFIIMTYKSILIAS